MALPLNLEQRAWRLAGRLLSIPPGTGILFGKRSRRQLLLAVLGSLLMAAIEVASVTAVVPLMQLVTGTPPDEGVPGRVASFLGISDAGTLTIVLASSVLGGFLLKGLVALAFRWWLLGVMMRQQVDTSRDPRVLPHRPLLPARCSSHGRTCRNATGGSRLRRRGHGRDQHRDRSCHGRR